MMPMNMSISLVWLIHLCISSINLQGITYTPPNTMLAYSANRKLSEQETSEED